jgi:hypothetical protein
MIEGRTILCFASGYDAPPTSKHHVMHLLAERNTVLWVNYHASRAPTASASDLRYTARKVGQIFRGITNPRKNLYVLTPPVLPLPGSAIAKRINRCLLITRIRSALRQVGRGCGHLLHVRGFAGVRPGGDSGPDSLGFRRRLERRRRRCWAAGCHGAGTFAPRQGRASEATDRLSMRRKAR